MLEILHFKSLECLTAATVGIMEVVGHVAGVVVATMVEAMTMLVPSTWLQSSEQKKTSK